MSREKILLIRSEMVAWPAAGEHVGDNARCAGVYNRLRFPSGNGDNGNVFGITNYRDQNRNQVFTYDALNRLTSAQNAGTN